MFNVLPGRKLEFRLNSKPSADGAWTVAVTPLSANAQSNLEYNLWVENRKQMVEKLSMARSATCISGRWMRLRSKSSRKS